MGTALCRRLKLRRTAPLLSESGSATALLSWCEGSRLHESAPDVIRGAFISLGFLTPLMIRSYRSHSEGRQRPWRPRRSTFDARRPTFDVRRSTFGARRSTYHVRRSTFDVRRSTFDVRRATFDVRCSTPDGRRSSSTLDVRRSTLDVRRTACGGRRSTFDVRRSTIDGGVIGHGIVSS